MNKHQQSFEQLTGQTRKQRDRAKLTVQEIVAHVASKLTGIPGVTTNALAILVLGWLRQEQPDVLKTLSGGEINLPSDKSVSRDFVLRTLSKGFRGLKPLPSSRAKDCPNISPRRAGG